MKSVPMLYGRQGMVVTVPDDATVLQGSDIQSLPDPVSALQQAMVEPIASKPLQTLLSQKRPETIAITISDITRPVPNEIIVRCLLDTINEAGIGDDRVTIIIGTGMHRPSTAAERVEMLGEQLLDRCKVIDHRAEAPDTLVQVCQDPPVSINRCFVESDLRIVTGLIEPHFMAGFSGGRKGVCPALADSATVRRFHNYTLMADPRSTTGVLDGNPCHAESLRVARTVGVDFLVNVAIDRQRRPAAFFSGDMEQAHLAGTKVVGEWTGARVDAPFDLVVTNGGGYPLDQTFYQTVKGMVTPLAAMHERTTLLVASDCAEGIGSGPYTETMMCWGSDWQGFLRHIAVTDEVVKDQWQFQMHTRTLAKIGAGRLHLVTDGLPADTLGRLAVAAVNGAGKADVRCQRFIDRYLSQNRNARVAVIPEGPYTMVTQR